MIEIIIPIYLNIPNLPIYFTCIIISLNMQFYHLYLHPFSNIIKQRNQTFKIKTDHQYIKLESKQMSHECIYSINFSEKKAYIIWNTIIE